MKRAIILILSAIMMVASCAILVACGEDNTSSSNQNPTEQKNPIYGFEDSDNYHYLVFKVKENEIARMLVVEGDTYEDLEPYFPLIDAEEDVTSDDGKAYYFVWEKLDKVYDENKKEIKINAVLRIYPEDDADNS